MYYKCVLTAAVQCVCVHHSCVLGVVHHQSHFLSGAQSFLSFLCQLPAERKETMKGTLSEVEVESEAADQSVETCRRRAAGCFSWFGALFWGFMTSENIFV